MAEAPEGMQDEEPPIWEIGDEILTQDTLKRLLEVYDTSLSYDAYDVEANFNLAGIYFKL